MVPAATVDDKFFSHGQVQLFGLAAATLCRSRILVLDEATSSLDNAMREIVDVIASWSKDCTVLAIAHKLDSILSDDKVAVFDEGCLVEFDSPRALVKRQSMFADLYMISRIVTSVAKRFNSFAIKVRPGSTPFPE